MASVTSPRIIATLLAASLLCLLAPATWARDKLPRLRRSTEFKYVDEADDDDAAKLLPKLLKKYNTPKKCEGLLKALGKRSYPGRMPSRMTLDYACPDGKTRQFSYILPGKYSKRKPTGVLIFLHGAIRQGPPGGGANEAGMFAPAVRRLNLIVIGPSTYEGVEWGTPQCRALIHHAIQFAKQYFNVDENRIYVAGDSDGGRGAYVQIETEATFLAAAVPVIGAPGGVTRFLNFRGVPIFAINGETDGIFKVENVRRYIEGMKASGIDITYKEIAGKGHDPRFFLTYKDEVCDFLEAHPREPFPEVVQWHVDPSKKDFDGGFPADTFRWIRIVETGSTSSNGTFDDGSGGLIRGGFPRIEASREGNRIDVKTRGVKRFAVLVSGDMLDLSSEIEVFTNGKLSFKGLVEANANVILEEARRFKDRHLLFANRITIDVDADPAEDENP